MLIGLVGKPNVGKSTFFKAATLAKVEIANYPFTTIQANEGVAYVRVKCPETEITELKQNRKRCEPNHGFCINGERFVPIKLIDVAGLVPEAHKGKGRGNEFLNDLREADCLIHILDISGKTNEKGEKVEDYDFTKDVEFLVYEIDKWISQILEKNWKSLVRKSKLSSPVIELTQQLSGLKIKEEEIKLVLNDLKLNVDLEKWTEKEIFKFAQEIRKINKPLIIAANKADTKEADANLKKLKEKFPNLKVFPCSAESELALREANKEGLIEYIPGDKDFKILNKEKINDKQKQALDFIKNNELRKYGSTGVQEILNYAVFNVLKQIVVYPVENENHFSDSKGKILPDAYLLNKNSTALDLAFTIHTDIGKNFVSAIDAKTKRRIGKETTLKNGDIIKIMTYN